MSDKLTDIVQNMLDHPAPVTHSTGDGTVHLESAQLYMGGSLRTLCDVEYDSLVHAPGGVRLDQVCPKCLKLWRERMPRTYTIQWRYGGKWVDRGPMNPELASLIFMEWGRLKSGAVPKRLVAVYEHAGTEILDSYDPPPEAQK